MQELGLSTKSNAYKGASKAFRNQQDKTVARLTEFIAGREPSPQLVIDFMAQCNSSTSKRTVNPRCQAKTTGGCTTDSCCVPELLASSWRTMLRAASTARKTPTKLSAALKSQDVADFLKTRQEKQANAGRANTTHALISAESVEAICIVCEQLAESAYYAGRWVEYVCYRQISSILTLDVGTGHRNKGICQLALDTVCDTRLETEDVILLNVMNQKVMDSPGLCKAHAVPGAIRCPKRQLQKYLEALRNVGFWDDFVKGNLLYPKFNRSRGTDQSKLTPVMRANHSDEHDYNFISTGDVNARLKELMCAARIPEEQQSFTIHTVRAGRVLVELSQGTSVSKINQLLGWKPGSNMWKKYSRMAQISAFLTPSRPLSLELGVQAQSLTLTPVTI
jgi:hypothetical protein